MPGSLDGFGLAKWTRKNKPQIKFILSGSIERTADVAASLCHSGPHSKQSYEAQLLLSRIRRLLASPTGDAAQYYESAQVGT